MTAEGEGYLRKVDLDDFDKEEEDRPLTDEEKYLVEMVTKTVHDHEFKKSQTLEKDFLDELRKI